MPVLRVCFSSATSRRGTGCHPTSYSPCSQQVFGNILLRLKKGARKSAFLLWDTYNHDKPNKFFPSFPGIQNTYGNPELLQIFFQENDIVTKIFLMAAMDAVLVCLFVLGFLCLVGFFKKKDLCLQHKTNAALFSSSIENLG